MDRPNANLIAILSFLAFLTLAAQSARAQQPTFKLDGETVTVSTNRYTAAFRYGALVELKSKLTDEVFLAAPEDLADRLDKMPFGLQSLAGLEDRNRPFIFEQLHTWIGLRPTERNVPTAHHPSAKSKVALKEIDGGAEVTWTGLEGYSPRQFHPDQTFTLRLRVLPETGELEILAAGKGQDKGAYGCGMLFTGLSPATKLILPLYGGFAFRPADEKPFVLNAHWPTPWLASLVIAEGKAGCAGFWMADPKLQDRYLHIRNSPKTVDLAFESINDAPFDNYTEAPCRPIRLNVYKNSWTEAAGAYRQWWEQAFKVQPLDQREPKLLRERCWISAWGQLPPADIARQAVHMCPQVWKKGPPAGDGGLLPYEVDQGPQLNEMKNLLDPLKKLGCQPWVYVNISYFSQSHPWAKKFWADRVIGAFADPKTLQAPLNPAKADCFEIHCGSKAWQDVIVDWTKQINQRYGITGFYMDCAAGNANNLGGLVGGVNDCQGEIDLMRREKAAVPGAFLGVEFLNEVTAQVTDIGGAGYDGWFTPGNEFPGGQQWRLAHVHPIVGCLFNRYTHLMYFDHQFPAFDETIGRLPMVAFEDLSQADVENAQTATFAQHFARLRCQTKMRPEYPAKWDAAVRAYYADPAGNHYRILAETPTESRMIRTAPDGKDELVYWRIENRTEAELGAGKGLAGWVAYDGAKAIGLNPKAAYLYTAAERMTDWQVTALPKGVFIQSCRPYKKGLLVLDLATADGKPASGELTLQIAKDAPLTFVADGVATHKLKAKSFTEEVTAPGTVAFVAGDSQTLEPDDAGLVLDLSKAAPPFYANLAANGLREPVIRKPNADPNKKTLGLMPNWEHSGVADYWLELPLIRKGQKLTLSFQSLAPAYESNRYTLTVQVNGKELLRQERKGNSKPMEHQIDLTDLAVKDVLISIGIHDAPLFDWARLVEPKISVK